MTPAYPYLTNQIRKVPMSSTKSRQGNILIIGLIVLAIVSGGAVFATTSLKKSQDSAMDDTKMTDDTVTKDSSDDAMMDDTGDVVTKESSANYQPYSEASYAAATNQKRVLFFHATWCPDCQNIDKQLQADSSSIPEGAIVFIVDYDKEKDLKAKYNITYQHTFVQVDTQGNAVSTWNDTTADTIAENIK